MGIRKSNPLPEDIEIAGIWWLKEEIEDKNRETKVYAWWGICKKTRKVAFMRYITNNLYEMMPLVMNDIYLNETHCDDGKYCLNMDCPLSTSPKLIDAIMKQGKHCFDELDENNVLNYFERSIKFITEEFIEGLPEDKLNEIFVTGYDSCHFNENAWVSKVGGNYD
ncbi:MAG: hypothetical protein IKF11_09055 [Methanobrevibacter sp.]|nr:hypothetical protein [Methanobrevibacter sp.]